MDAVTYPDEQVADYITKHFVPVQIDISKDQGAMAQFNAVWTPTVILRDDGGKEYRRSEGFLAPEDLLAELSLSRLQAALHKGKYDEAVSASEDAVLRAQSDPERLAEARYWAGVAAYKASGEGRDLTRHWGPLLKEMPDTAWAKKASFIKDS
jgi:hypothetical protein